MTWQTLILCGAGALAREMFALLKLSSRAEQDRFASERSSEVEGPAFLFFEDRRPTFYPSASNAASSNIPTNISRVSFPVCVF
jgi:hypothetical protein